MNITCSEDGKIEDLPIGTFIKVVGILSYVLSNLGNFLLWSIVHYEKFGRDPQKRSFPDQVLSFNFILGGFFSVIHSTIVFVRTIYGPVGITITQLRYYVMYSGGSIIFGYTETMLFRCLMILSWKHCAMVNDEFLATFMNIFNVMISQMISIVRFYLGNFFLHKGFQIFSGYCINVKVDQLRAVDLVYTISIHICFIAQMVIYFKKKFEQRRDRFAAGNIKYEEKTCMNTQKWNPYICTTPQMSIILLIVFILHFSSGNLLLKWSNLNSNEKSLLTTNIVQVIINLGVPLYMYGKNKSMFQYLIHDIFGEFFGMENILTNFPKLPSTCSMIYPCTKKLQSKSESLTLSTSPCTDTSNTLNKTNEMNQNQAQEETFDKVNTNPNHKVLQFNDQKALLSANRLKNAGFQLSNNTPEDGNCLIHALKDQMSLDPLLQSMAAQYSVQELRELIAATIKNANNADNAKNYLLSDDNHREVLAPDDWLDFMNKDGKWCDDIFIYLAATFLKKELIFLPIDAKDGHGTSDKIIISPKIKIGNPFYMLYYKNVHFQSIIPTT